MSKRTMVPMESLIKSISMGPFGSDVKVEYMRDFGVPIIDGSNLTSIKMNMTNYRFLDESRAKKLDAALAHKGDIVVTHRGTLGQLSYVPADCPFDEILISQSQFRISLDTSQVNPIYFAYYFHTKEGQKRLLSFANYVGVPALACATTNFRKLSFPLIPLEEQNRIATLLEELDFLIANNNAIISELEAMAKDIYDYWFVQFDFPDENGKPYRACGGKMVWNDELKREIPDGWAVKTINSLVSASRGISYSTESITGTAGVPMINLASFNVDASYKPAGLKVFSGDYSKEDILRPFDLIMCNTQQTDLDPKKDIIGKMMLVPDLFDGDIVSSHHITHLQTEDLSMRVFLNATGKTSWFHKAMSGHCSGTSILGLDVKHALEYKLSIPEKSIRLSFTEKIIPIEKQKCVLMRENAELTSLRDWLLPMLMNGQVKVGGVE